MDIHKLQEIFNKCELSGDKIIVESNIAKLIELIKENYGFDMLKEITAVDLMEKGVELIYRLYSVEDEEEVLVSTTVENEAESISKLFDSAVADEKEIYDLFGIKFIGNKELERLYMPGNWQGHPLKKDYEEKDERLNWNERN